MSRKRSMTKSDWNRRKKEILAWKVPKNTEKKVFTDGVIVNIYDTAGRLLWRYERYWNVIGRFAEGDYRYSKRFNYDEKGNLIRLTEKQTPPHKTPSMMITYGNGKSLCSYLVFEKENGPKIRYYLTDGTYSCMVCRENSQKPWVFRGPAEGKYFWKISSMKWSGENQNGLSVSVTVYTDILSTEMFLEILDYFRPMCSTDIFIYFDGWYTVPEEISKKNEQEARKREISYFLGC